AKIHQMSGGQLTCPIVFRGPTGSAGQLGAQHSQNFENWYANTPGLKVVIPSDPHDAKGLLKSAIIDPDPVIFMESEVMYGDKGNVPDEEYYLPIGKANIINEGTDVTLVSFGKMISRAVKPAVEELEKEGISVELIDLRSVRPIDFPTVIESVKKTNRLVIVEEAWPLASISSEVSFHVQKHAFDYLDAPVLRVTSADVPLGYAPTLVEASLPNVAKIVKAVKEVSYISK
ncbi:MAG: alpha-ketoacid dehydrogenase subunit beta, partial [Sphingobacterium sp.]